MPRGESKSSVEIKDSNETVDRDIFPFTPFSSSPGEKEGLRRGNQKDDEHHVLQPLKKKTSRTLVQDLQQPCISPTTVILPKKLPVEARGPERKRMKVNPSVRVLTFPRGGRMRGSCYQKVQIVKPKTKW